jgi:hypothetical protein
MKATSLNGNITGQQYATQQCNLASGNTAARLLDNGTMNSDRTTSTGNQTTDGEKQTMAQQHNGLGTIQ